MLSAVELAALIDQLDRHPLALRHRTLRPFTYTTTPHFQWPMIRKPLSGAPS
jgi:hypothetical protein